MNTKEQAAALRALHHSQPTDLPARHRAAPRERGADLATLQPHLMDFFGEGLPQEYWWWLKYRETRLPLEIASRLTLDHDEEQGGWLLRVGWGEKGGDSISEEVALELLQLHFSQHHRPTRDFAELMARDFFREPGAHRAR